MKTIKKEFGKAYLEFQPKLDALIKELVTNAGDELDHDVIPGVGALECRSRDGFSASSFNCGGYEVTAFTFVNSVIGSGTWFRSKKANAEIERQYSETCKYAAETLIEEHPELKGTEVNYNALYEAGKSDLAEKLSELEQDPDGNDSIMLQIRIMYCGVDDDGTHSAYVSAVINWEGPYHRSSGVFARGTGTSGYCTEDFKEVEVTWKNLKEAKSKLKKALKKVGGIF